jgi:2,4'-dihydroxyacetophenone dioxygenase
MNALPESKSPTQRLADFWAELEKRPLIPAQSSLSTLHIGEDELPYVEAGDGSAVQLLHVDLPQGLWILKMRMPPAYKVLTHYHTGFVYAVTLQGSWHYVESPAAVNKAGSYLYEPAGSLHTLTTPVDAKGDTIVWFAVHGANVNVDAEGRIVSIIDARTALDIYRGSCRALGLDYGKLIVVGE